MHPLHAPVRPSLSTPERLIAGLGPAILLAAALVPALRPVAAVIVAAGWTLLWSRRHPAAIAWAAVLPLAAALTWPWLLGADAPIGDPACRDPFSVIALRRVVLAIAVLALVAGLAAVHRSGTRELGIARPGWAEAVVAAGGCALLVVAGLIVGPAIARPFFGELDFPIPAAALVPALLFGVANGVLEEILYRGAMQAWLARLTPVGWAIAFQGLAFGVIHAGPEVLALLPVHIALLSAVGIAAGLVRWRLGSLWIPIGVHVGADIALYVGLACRPAP